MKKTKRFVDLFLVVMLLLGILYGMAKVMSLLVHWLPIEGNVGTCIMCALIFEALTFPVLLWIEAVLNARPLGKGFWRRIRKNLLEEMRAAKWIMITALAALVASVLILAAFLFICALILYTFKITPGPFLQFMCFSCAGFLLIGTDVSVASWIQNKCKKEIHK